MAEVTALLIKEVREKTGMGLKKCKEALLFADGSVDLAIEELRKQGLAAAEKRADRSASQGVIFLKVSADKKAGALVELNCETDFVAKTDDFANLGEKLVSLTLEKQVSNADALSGTNLDGTSVDDTIKGVIAKMGENIRLGKVSYLSSEGSIFTYSHGTGSIGVMLAVEGDVSGFEDVGKDLCMQIAAMSPEWLRPEEVPAAILAKEKEILAEQITGKPENVVEKIVEGRMRKFYAESCFLHQTFVKDDKKTVTDILGKSRKATSFVRAELGK